MDRPTTQSVEQLLLRGTALRETFVREFRFSTPAPQTTWCREILLARTLPALRPLPTVKARMATVPPVTVLKWARSEPARRTSQSAAQPKAPATLFPEILMLACRSSVLSME